MRELTSWKSSSIQYSNNNNKEHRQENKGGQSPRKTKEGRILTSTGSYVYSILISTTRIKDND